MPKTYSLFEAKSHLSEIIRNVKSGHEIVVTERGTPVAKIIPFIDEELSLAKKIAKMKKTGQIQERSESGSFPKNERATKKGALKRFLKDRE